MPLFEVGYVLECMINDVSGFDVVARVSLVQCAVGGQLHAIGVRTPNVCALYVGGVGVFFDVVVVFAPACASAHLQPS